MNKAITIAASLLATQAVYAETWYDDWNVEIQDITETVQYYGGYGACEYELQEVVPTGTGFEVVKQPLVKSNQFVGKSLEPYPTIKIVAPYSYLSSGRIHTIPNYQYDCKFISPLSETYTDEVVVDQVEVKTPIPPFASYTTYEFGACQFGVRRGFLSYENVSPNDNVKVRIASAGLFPSQVVFNGLSSGFIGFNSSLSGNVSVSLKIGNGSSKYFNLYIPECGTEAPEPF